MRQLRATCAGFAGKAVMEYGTGAGLLGQVLRKEGVRRYIGVDISQRQLDAASRRLPKSYFTPLRANALHDARLHFTDVDVFICQAVMQHFESDAYRDRFLRVLNESSIPFIMLQPRATGCKDNNLSSLTRSDITLANCISASQLATHLPKYMKVYESKLYANGYVYCIFRKR